MTWNSKEAGRQIALESRLPDEDKPTFDTLSQFQRDIVGATSARLHIPMLSGAQTIGSLKLVIRELERLISNVERMPNDQAQLFAIGGAIRHLNKRINCFRLKGKKRI